METNFETLFSHTYLKKRSCSSNSY